MNDILSDKYKRAGVIAALIFMVVVWVLLMILGMKIPDPPLEEYEIPLEVPVQTSGGSSSGSPSESKTTEKNSSTEAETKNIATQDESPVSSATADGDSNTESTETESSADESMMMGDWGNNGDGESGDGEGRLGEGDGDGIGDFTGPNEGSSGRNMLVGPSSDKLDKDKRGTIYLEMIVNKDGKVLSLEYYAAKSTSQDPELITHAKKMCKRVKFESSNRTTTEIVGPFKFTPK